VGTSGVARARGTRYAPDQQHAEDVRRNIGGVERGRVEARACLDSAHASQLIGW
jgi:hypothetical protein